MVVCFDASKASGHMPSPPVIKVDPISLRFKKEFDRESELLFRMVYICCQQGLQPVMDVYFAARCGLTDSTPSLESYGV